MIRPTTITALIAEIHRAHAQHGRSLEDAARSNPHRAVSILTEEVGEVARAVLEIDAAIGDGMPGIAASWCGDLRAELLQVAAVAIRWAQELEGEST